MPSGSVARFGTTRWSLVASAARKSPEGQRALAELCELYWPPVYAFLRRKVADRERAADLTQGFFADLLARDDLDKADRERGRFRSFLLKCAQNFAAKEFERQNAQKRGGGRQLVSLDAMREEDSGEFGFASGATPEEVFERRWATSLLARVTDELADEYRQRGREEVFSLLRTHLEHTSDAGGYQESRAELAARDIEMSESAVRVTVHRMRQRFRELLLAEVAQTVDGTQDPMDEVEALREALHRG